MKIECGKIVNTHGIAGELKVQSYCDGGFFKRIKAVSTENAAYKVESSREHAGFVLLRLEGINDMTSAEKLKGQVIFAEKSDIKMPENRVFYSDLYGFEIYDERFSEKTGILKSAQESAGRILLEIETEKGLMLLPDIPAFVIKKDLEKKTIYIRTIEGLYPDEN